MNVRFKNSLLVFAGLLFVTGCGLVGGGGGSSNESPTTGWDYNNPDYGGYEVKTGYEQEPGPGLVRVEGGTFTMGQTEQDVTYDWNNVPRRVTVSSFFMDQTEVRNVDYREYLHWIQRVFIDYPEVYRNALPDTLVWRSALAYNEPYVQYYFRHPAYNNYPVVGVNWLQANDYCVWRTDRVNEMRLVEEGILELDPNQVGRENFNTEAYLAGQYEGLVIENLPSLDPNEESRIVSLEDGIILPRYRLPTEAEWEYAASSLVGIRDYNVYRGRKKYPWDGQYTRSGDVKKQGDQLANFKQSDGDYGGIAGWSDDGADITAEVKSYEPNDFGLYDMAGNVAEWVADVYRPIVDDEFNDFNYYRGNVYTKNAINEDGSVKVVGVEEIEFDTLATGRLVARSYPGDIAQIPVTEEDTYMRTNYTDSDQRNFRDGDKSSSRYYRSYQEAEDDSQRMYNSPTYNVAGAKDSTGVAQRGYDSADRTTLISDEVRVYKGGSWRDRAYWLDPAQRRYFPQDMATDYIGFRNAMSRVGSKSLDDNKKAKN